MKLMKKMMLMFLLLALQLNQALAGAPDISFRGEFVATGISESGLASEAELNMLANANKKCFTVAGSRQIGEPVFRLFRGVMYASARFECVESALDRRKCAYPDDTEGHECFGRR